MKKERFKISSILLEKMLKYLINEGNTYRESIKIINEFENSRLPKNYPNKDDSILKTIDVLKTY